MSRPAVCGCPVRRPGEAFGLVGVGGPAPAWTPFGVEPVAQLRAWSLRMRMAGELQLGLRQLLLDACDDAGLVGPAGEALRTLGQQLSADASVAATAAFDAADELDRWSVAEVLGSVDGDQA